MFLNFLQKLSPLFKESFKTALAMTIAYGIALSMDWDTPMWAGFSVAFVSLSTSGQSFNKSAMRMFGTLIAAVMSLILIALFPQDRWLFMLALSIYVGFCTYMMGSAKYQYFWFVCGYVCIIVALEAGPSSTNAFELAILRSQETGLGILVYSVITALLWRNNSADNLHSIMLELTKIQSQLSRHYAGLVFSNTETQIDVSQLQEQQAQNLFQFKMLIDGGETDSYQIFEQRQQWRLYQQQTTRFSALIEQSYHMLSSLENLSVKPLLPQLLPGLNDFKNQTEQRFIQIETILEDKEFTPLSSQTFGPINQSLFNTLTALQKSAILTFSQQIQDLDQITLDLLNTIATIKGVAHKGVAHIKTEPLKYVAPVQGSFVPNIERLSSVVQIMATLWLTYLAFIYVYDLPVGIGVVIVSGVIGMFFATNPSKPVSIMFKPFATNVILVSLLYVFVMPQISSFWGLGPMIFIATFLICYIYSSPLQAIGRASGLAIFITLISIDNQQTYNILMIFNGAILFIMMFAALVIGTYIPFSPKPEYAFVRLLKRFLSSNAYLMMALSSKHKGKPVSWWQQQKQNFHLQEIKTLPQKLEVWSQAIKVEALPGTHQQNIKQLSKIIKIMSHQMVTLLQYLPKDNDKKHDQLKWPLTTQQQITIWQDSMQIAFQDLSKHLSLDNPDTFYNQLNDILVQIEKNVAGTENIQKTQVSNQDDFYHLLGAYQGVSDALVAYSKNSEDINWHEWQASKF
ncbi:MAG: hypothetical protein DRQ47_04700 [Gammaproteobacteria bacterium]|nr:MAG: hypothetical protein DRQ47_04700 [Gammaproteobacteria bacterium]